MYCTVWYYSIEAVVIGVGIKREPFFGKKTGGG